MRKKTQEEYIEDLYKVNPHLHLKSDYINSRTKVSIDDDRCHHLSARPFSIPQA